MRKLKLQVQISIDGYLAGIFLRHCGSAIPLKGITSTIRLSHLQLLAGNGNG
ncbi:MAG: hypothetical protein H6555_04970 [Lewinellaceae bacterium]|nr:hypothetical protein [Lewinellaceae bacterium]